MNFNLDIFDLCINRIYSCFHKAILDNSLSEEELSIYQQVCLDVESELKKLRYTYNKFLEENE